MSDLIMSIATWLTTEHSIALSGWIWLIICIPSALIVAFLVAALVAITGFLEGIFGALYRL